MEMKKGTRVTIEIYDADGEYCESIRGRLGYEEIRERMIDALKNDGIPVIRQHGKHETEDDKPEELGDEEFTPGTGSEIYVHWSCNGVEFEAEGPAEYVLRESNEMAAVLEAMAK